MDNTTLLARIDERTQRMDKAMILYQEAMTRLLDDHEIRLRKLEGSTRWAVGRDLGAYLAIAITAVKSWFAP